MVRREGKAWAGASGAMGGCEGYRPLMQQLQLLCTACVAAVSEVIQTCSAITPSKEIYLLKCLASSAHAPTSFEPSH